MGTDNSAFGDERLTRSGHQVVFAGARRPLEYREDSVAGPQSTELLVRVTLAGVCGTDAHRLAGDLPDPPAPISLGHESVGVVEVLGTDLRQDVVGTPLAIGDRVHWKPSMPCGRCRACAVLGDVSQCGEIGWPASAATPNAAGFRTYATLNERMTVVRVPDEVSSEALIALGCALPTAVAGIRRIGGISPLQRVVIQGSGPVGLAATLVAGICGASEIIVIGDPVSRLATAERFGATLTLSLVESTPEERAAAVAERTSGWGADVVIEASGNHDAFAEGINLVGRGGAYLILGLYAGHAPVDLNPYGLNNRNQRVVGSFASSREDVLTAMEIVRRHGSRLQLADLVTHRFALTQVPEAVETVRSGAATKAVIDLGR